MSNSKRIRIIVGHYGSGKTEFCVNYGIKLADKGKKVALIDLDIANPYFRSRERQKLLESKGIHLYSNCFGYDITADLPAITAAIRAPLEDIQFDTIVDSGGDDSGARVLNQIDKYLLSSQCDIFCVINGNRPETSDLDGALNHIKRIEREINTKITGLINNTHMLKETDTEDILKGYRLTKQLSRLLDIPVKYHCCTGDLMQQVEKNIEASLIFPMRLYMREGWHDR